jgi:predicted secreted Zn-dependent protease
MIQKLLVLFFFSLIAAAPADDSLIDWSASRKLTWNDFKAKPDAESSNAALTSSTINVEFGYDKNGLKHSITCRFNKLKSWGRVKNDYILNHEQGHFDLAEGYARQLHRELIEYVFKKESVSNDLNTIYSRVMRQHMQAQDQYDKQTDHSLDTAKQSAWDIKIRSMLKELEGFKDYK